MPVALDIGSRVVHLVAGDVSNSKINLKNARILKMPIEMTGDDVNRLESLQSILITALKDWQLKRENGAITLSFSRFLLRELEIPQGKPDEIRQMVRQELVHFYNVNNNDVIEALHLPGRDLSDGRIAVQGAAINRTVVDDYYHMLHDSGLRPTIFSMHNCAISALTASKPQINGYATEGNTIVFLDLGMEATLVQVVTDGQLILSRHLPIGFGELDRIISAGLERSLEEAAELRQSTFSLDEESISYHTLNATSKQQLDLFLARLTEELNKIIRFYSSSIGRGSPISRVFIFGAGSEVKGILNRLETALNYNIEEIRSFSNINVQSQAKDIPLRHLVNACGALCLL